MRDACAVAWDGCPVAWDGCPVAWPVRASPLPPATGHLPHRGEAAVPIEQQAQQRRLQLLGLLVREGARLERFLDLRELPANHGRVGHLLFGHLATPLSKPPDP